MNNQEIADLCDWIEECQALAKTFPGYINDPLDLDRQECFV